MKNYAVVALLCFFSLAHVSVANAQMMDPSAGLQNQPVGVVGVELQYQVRIPLPLSISPVWYKLLKGPSGMVLDSAIGLIKWTPNAIGYFPVEVAAYTNRGKVGFMSLKFKVVSFLGSMAGVIKNDSGAVLRNILVTLYPKFSSAINMMGTISGATAVSDSMGRYQITGIDSGSYFVQARPLCDPRMMMPMPCVNGEYAQVWYVDSPTMNGAAAVAVTNADMVSVNFTMHKVQKPVPLSIAGTVRDGSGKAVSGATVIAAFAPKSASSSSPSSPVGTFQDNTFGYFGPTVGVGRTDGNGFYKISVRSGEPYVVSAMARGFLLQYFKGKNNALEADKLVLTKDTSGVDFALTPVTPAVAKVAGQVTDSAGFPVIAKLVLFNVRPQVMIAIYPPPPMYCRSIHTDSTGHFVFDQVPNGKYMLQVVPFRGYLPTYFKANDCGVRNPRLADTIEVKNDASVSGLSVCVKKVNTTGGGRIAGFVRISGGMGIAGVVVTAELAGSSVKTFAVTESNGSYELADLDQGSYTIYAEKLGYNSATVSNTLLDYSKGIVDKTLDIVLPASNTTSVEFSKGIPQSIVLGHNYPNPFNPSTQITFSLAKESRATVKVFNILGQPVATLVEGTLSAGEHRVTFDAADLPSGVYLYELQADGKRIVNKMLLMR